MDIELKTPEPPVEERVKQILNGERDEIRWWETLVALKNRLEESDQELRDELTLYRVDTYSDKREPDFVTYDWNTLAAAMSEGVEVRPQNSVD